MKPITPPAYEDILAARRRLHGTALHTPLLQLWLENSPVDIYLKLENLQPLGSFKVRGAGNAVLQLSERDRSAGVWTASAGNMGLALAWFAHRLGIPCSILVPEDAPEVKINAARALGARILRVPFADYQQVQRTHFAPGMAGHLVHPFADQSVMAGNAVIGLEILEDLPEVDAILVPYGGGGLSCGIASAVRALRQHIRVLGCEVESAAPLSASLSAGKMVNVPFSPSFVSGLGAPFVFDEMWPLASALLDGAIPVSLQSVAEAIRMLVSRCRVIAEGAGAVSLAAVLSGRLPPLSKNRKPVVVCIVSGGNLNANHLIEILEGHVPASR